jgi:peptide deformylase
LGENVDYEFVDGDLVFSPNIIIMPITKIVTYPYPTLLEEAQDVVFPLSNEDKTLLRNMWDTVAGIGVGLAAPQLGVSHKICIISLSKNMIPKGVKIRNNFAIINPVIVEYSARTCNMVEGCLSFPNQWWQINRPTDIVLEYSDEKGKRQRMKATGWMARVIQHEVDHLQGKVFINAGGIKIEEHELGDHDIVD